ncbi:cupin domain-containing protein [Novosphingobium endophyticum]|uniref:cupin domain-containing protein n=1 Tax=Novosphingobium endophyticum TaxID=1955250 RepID=UPI001666C3FE|nr:cupin domain-containing protein [Novosphingobium endophyticum]
MPKDELLAVYLQQGIPGHDAQGFHRTGTLDLVLLLEGRLRLLLDEGEVVLEPGDVVVQRDTNHAWRAGDDPARCFVVVSRPEDLP